VPLPIEPKYERKEQAFWGKSSGGQRQRQKLLARGREKGKYAFCFADDAMEKK
jgi:hypothetical protein